MSRIDTARALRKRMSLTEARLWLALRRQERPAGIFADSLRSAGSMPTYPASVRA